MGMLDFWRVPSEPPVEAAGVAPLLLPSPLAELEASSLRNCSLFMAWVVVELEVAECSADRTTELQQAQ